MDPTLHADNDYGDDPADIHNSASPPDSATFRLQADSPDGHEQNDYEEEQEYDQVPSARPVSFELDNLVAPGDDESELGSSRSISTQDTQTAAHARDLKEENLLLKKENFNLKLTLFYTNEKLRGALPGNSEKLLAELIELQVKIKEVTTEAEHRRTLITKARDLIRALRDEIDALKKTRQAEGGRVQADAIEQQFQQRLSLLEQQYQKRLSDTALKHQNEMTSINERHQTDVLASEQQHRQQIAYLEKQLQEQKQAMTECDNSLGTVETQLQAAQERHTFLALH